MDDANVAHHAQLFVDAQALAADQTLTFDGSAETDGAFNIVDDAGDDTLIGGGTDILRIDGNYSADLTLGAHTITSIERIYLDTGHNYDITTDDANVAAGWRWTHRRWGRMPRLRSTAWLRPTAASACSAGAATMI